MLLDLPSYLWMLWLLSSLNTFTGCSWLSTITMVMNLCWNCMLMLLYSRSSSFYYVQAWCLHSYLHWCQLDILVAVTISTFLSMDLALFLECILSYCSMWLSYHKVCYLYLFSHEISISPMLSQPSFNFHAVHDYAFFSFLPFWCLTHHTCLCFHSMHSLFNFHTHSPGLRVCLMHTVSVDPIQSCTNSITSI